MSKTFKRVFQPLEIAFKKMLGIKKVKKGRIFDEAGKICHNQEKNTRYVLFVPFFQKIKMLVSASNVPNYHRGGERLFVPYFIP